MITVDYVFDKLCKNVQDCRKCVRMNNSLRVLNRSVGRLNARIMFIGEAPGRLGADDSGIPFHGDKSGHNFEELLAFAGLNRAEIYITNSVLCNPKDEKGNNSTPNSSEILNCSGYLQKQIELVNPVIVVTLGATALSATNLLAAHGLNLKDHVRTANKWFDRILIPLYHPGQRAMLHRSMANQRSDYKFITDQIKNIDNSKIKLSSGYTSLDSALIVDYLFTKKSSYTYFALHKLFYLIEYKSLQKLGQRLTNAYIIRQKDGPYCTDLNIYKLKKTLPYLQSKPLSRTNVLVYKGTNSLFGVRLLDEYLLNDSTRELIDDVLAMHGNKSNAGLKRTVYFTQPMRNILYQEEQSKINLYNSPIEFTLDSCY